MADDDLHLGTRPISPEEQMQLRAGPAGAARSQMTLPGGGRPLRLKKGDTADQVAKELETLFKEQDAMRSKILQTPLSRLHKVEISEDIADLKRALADQQRVIDELKQRLQLLQLSLTGSQTAEQHKLSHLEIRLIQAEKEYTKLNTLIRNKDFQAILDVRQRAIETCVLLRSKRTQSLEQAVEILSELAYIKPIPEEIKLELTTIASRSDVTDALRTKIDLIPSYEQEKKGNFPDKRLRSIRDEIEQLQSEGNYEKANELREVQQLASTLLKDTTDFLFHALEECKTKAIKEHKVGFFARIFLRKSQGDEDQKAQSKIRFMDAFKNFATRIKFEVLPATREDAPSEKDATVEKIIKKLVSDVLQLQSSIDRKGQNIAKGDYSVTLSNITISNLRKDLAACKEKLAKERTGENKAKLLGSIEELEAKIGKMERELSFLEDFSRVEFRELAQAEKEMSGILSRAKVTPREKALLVYTAWEKLNRAKPQSLERLAPSNPLRRRWEALEANLRTQGKEFLTLEGREEALKQRVLTTPHEFQMLSGAPLELFYSLLSKMLVQGLLDPVKSDLVKSDLATIRLLTLLDLASRSDIPPAVQALITDYKQQPDFTEKRSLVEKELRVDDWSQRVDEGLRTLRKKKDLDCFVTTAGILSFMRSFPSLSAVQEADIATKQQALDAIVRDNFFESDNEMLSRVADRAPIDPREFDRVYTAVKTEMAKLLFLPVGSERDRALDTLQKVFKVTPPANSPAQNEIIRRLLGAEHLWIPALLYNGIIPPGANPKIISAIRRELAGKIEKNRSENAAEKGAAVEKAIAILNTLESYPKAKGLVLEGVNLAPLAQAMHEEIMAMPQTDITMQHLARYIRDRTMLEALILIQGEDLISQQLEQARAKLTQVTPSANCFTLITSEMRLKKQFLQDHARFLQFLPQLTPSDVPVVRSLLMKEMAKLLYDTSFQEAEARERAKQSLKVLLERVSTSSMKSVFEDKSQDFQALLREYTYTISPNAEDYETFVTRLNRAWKEGNLEELRSMLKDGVHTLLGGFYRQNNNIAWLEPEISRKLAEFESFLQGQVASLQERRLQEIKSSVGTSLYAQLDSLQSYVRAIRGFTTASGSDPNALQLHTILADFAQKFEAFKNEVGKKYPGVEVPLEFCGVTRQQIETARNIVKSSNWFTTKYLRPCQQILKQAEAEILQAEDPEHVKAIVTLAKQGIRDFWPKAPGIPLSDFFAPKQGADPFSALCSQLCEIEGSEYRSFDQSTLKRALERLVANNHPKAALLRRVYDDFMIRPRSGNSEELSNTRAELLSDFYIGVVARKIELESLLPFIRSLNIQTEQKSKLQAQINSLIGTATRLCQSLARGQQEGSHSTRIEEMSLAELEELLAKTAVTDKEQEAINQRRKQLFETQVQMSGGTGQITGAIAENDYLNFVQSCLALIDSLLGLRGATLEGTPGAKAAHQRLIATYRGKAEQMGSPAGALNEVINRLKLPLNLDVTLRDFLQYCPDPTERQKLIHLYYEAKNIAKPAAI